MKKFFKVMVAMTMFFVLTGCMKIRTNVVIKDEDNASMTMDVLYSKEMMDSYKMDADDLKDQFATGDYEESDFKDIKETIDGKEYLGFSVKSPKKEANKILDQLTVKDVNGKKEYVLEITKDSLNKNMDPSSLGGAQYSLKQMKDNGLEMTMTIQMPGKITDVTIGKVKGDTVTIDLLEATEAATKGTIATVTSSEGGAGNTVYLYAAIGVAIIAAIAVAYVVISKKKKNNNEDPNAVTIEDPTEVISDTEVPGTPITEETVNLEPVVEQTTDVVEETVNPEPVVEQTTDVVEETVNPEPVIEQTTDVVEETVDPEPVGEQATDVVEEAPDTENTKDTTDN